MPPSALDVERTPERNRCSSPEASQVHSRSWHALLSQPRSLKVCKPHSWVYPRGFPILRPRQVSRNGIPAENIEKTSSIYVYEKDRTYFEQCFKELRVLGRGLFGEALEVECRETGKRYAVKRALHTFESAGNRQLKLREATNHEAIPPHKNIVRFEKAWEERGRLYIQTELCGANLEEYRDEFGILPENELWKVLYDMVHALHHLHSTGVLHLDVKPSNIFISNDSICKLGDFGLAFDMNKIPRDSAEEGDKYYMAPEILNDSPTTAADIYSLGVSMLELATDIDLREQSPKVRNGELAADLFGNIHDELREMIQSLILPDPLDRPTTSQLLSDEKLLANTRDRVTFRRIETDRKIKLQSGPLDKDWDFEFEDEIHPPSLRFSKPRVPLRDLRREDIADTVESVRTCLRFDDSSDDDSPSYRTEK
nr:Serine threonine protein kinase-related domain containing protein [Haemonchus contortus]